MLKKQYNVVLNKKRISLYLCFGYFYAAFLSLVFRVRASRGSFPRALWSGAGRKGTPDSSARDNRYRAPKKEHRFGEQQPEDASQIPQPDMED